MAYAERGRNWSTDAGATDSTGTTRATGATRRALLGRVAVVGTVGGVLAACAPLGGGQPAAPQRAQQPVTLRYTTFWNQQRLDVIDPAIKEFQQITGHTVRMESVPDYAEKLVVEFVGGTAADVPQASNTVMPKLFDQGVILDLTPYVNRDRINLRRDYGLMGQEFWDGKIYAMPYVLSPHAWYYNKSMLREVGAPDPWEIHRGDLSWADFLAIARATTAPAQGNRPERWGVMLTYNDIEYQLGGIIWSNGGRTHDWTQYKYTMDHPKSIEAVQWVHDLLHRHRVMMSTATRTQLRESGVANPFISGQVAMFEDSTGQLNALAQGVQDQFEWDVFPIMRAARGGPPATVYTSGDPNTVNAGSQHKDAAWEFAKWLAGRSMQGLIGRTKLLYPALNSAASDERGFSQPPPAHVRVFADVFKGNVFRRFFHYNHAQGLDIFRQHLNRAFDENSVSVEQALREATREANLIVEGRSRPTFPD